MRTKAGRPSKLTPQTQARLVTALSAGNYYEAACSYADIDYTTFRLWMRKGEKAKSGKYFDFFNAVKKAEQEAEIRLVLEWQKHMPEDWKAIAKFMERRYPDRWGRRMELRQDIKQEVKGQVEVSLADRIEKYADVFERLEQRGLYEGTTCGDSPGEPLDTA